MTRFVATQQALHPERFARSTFVGGQLVLLGPVLLPIALAGLRELFGHPRFRVLGWVVVGTFGVLLAAAGKAYYAGPLYVLLMAAGALAMSRWARTTGRRVALGGLVAASFLGTLPFMTAALPVRTMIDTGIYTVRAEFAEMLGWDDLVDTVAGVWNALPASGRDRALILTRSYGEAGAIEVLGAPRGLPFPASGHDGWFFWKPARDPAVVIGVGVESVCRAFFRDVRQVATIDNRFGVANQTRGLPVLVCRDPTRSLLEHWDEVVLFA
jgi:type IV secretory pathway VirB2 component (pilin)